MKLRKLSWLAALVVFLALVLGATGSAAAAPPGDHLPQIEDPTSVRFDIEGSISTSGGTIPISGQGAAAGDDLMLDAELQAPAGASGPDKLTFNVVAVGSKFYFKTTGLSDETDDKWYVVEVPGMGLGGIEVLAGIDMDVLHDAVTVTSTSKETVNGAPTTRYNMNVNPDALRAAGPDVEEGVILETTVTLTMWVGDTDMYVHKLAVASESVATVGETTSFARVEVTVTFKDFDTPITITPPADAEPIDIESVLADMPLGDLLGGLPGAIPSVPVDQPSEMPTGMPSTGTGTGTPLSSWPLALFGIGAATLACGIALRRREVR
jgi:hypothetical protein